MTLEFYPLRFDFIALQPIRFPPGKAANTLRGAMGIAFRKVACAPECSDAKSCPIRQSCAYAKVFEPVGIGGPSGLADSPRPFVFRARHLDGCTIQAGAPFHFDLNLFTRDEALLPYFAGAFAVLAGEGLGPQRAKSELRSPAGTPRLSVLDLSSKDDATTKIRVDFLSPIELKHEQRIVTRPDFPVLFARIRDRIATLSRLYGSGPLEVDYNAIGQRAASINLTRCLFTKAEVERRSSRTGQSHSIGGFTGTAEYEGDLSEFLPWLFAARHTGIGRHASWGNGEISIERLT